MKPCEYCGTPFDDSDYQEDGYRHSDARCREYLKAALSAANKDAACLRSVMTELAKNAEALLADGLPHFTRRDFATAVADRARAALEGRAR